MRSDKYGQRTPESYLPAQCYFEVSEEKVNEGRLRAETLAQVISLEEEEAQERSKPEHPKQLDLGKPNTTDASSFHLTDAKISGAVADEVSSSFQHVAPGQASSARPCTPQGPGRTHVAIVVGRAFEQEELCFSTAAGKLRSDGWTRLEPLPGVRISDSKRGLATHGRRRSGHRCSTLGYAVWNIGSHFSQWPMPGQKRTNRPRTQPWKTKSTRSKSSLLTSGTTGRGRGKSFGKGQPRDTTKNSNPAPPSSKSSKTFETIQKKHGLTLFHEKARSSPGICFRFQKHACFDSGKCRREHICIGCGKAGVPYNHYFYLKSSMSRLRSS